MSDSHCDALFERAAQTCCLCLVLSLATVSGLGQPASTGQKPLSRIELLGQALDDFASRELATEVEPRGVAFSPDAKYLVAPARGRRSRTGLPGSRLGQAAKAGDLSLHRHSERSTGD